jgi:Fe-S cluster biogenesis protein NfuA
MPMIETLDAREFQGRLQRLDEGLRELENLGDPAARATIREVVQGLLELHGSGLSRILGHLAEAGDAGAAILDACSRDEVAAGLLLLHGLHPQDLESRVRQALEDVRPRLRAHQGDVELMAISDGVVRLRLLGSCHGCASSAVTMRQTIEQAVLGRAPDAVALEVEGVSEEPSTTPDGRPLVVLTIP